MLGKVSLNAAYIIRHILNKTRLIFPCIIKYSNCLMTYYVAVSWK